MREVQDWDYLPVSIMVAIAIWLEVSHACGRASLLMHDRIERSLDLQAEWVIGNRS